ncbi:MAG: Mur ligase domain-containing protein, partial [Nocardioides sp.]|nr:Mur ligase domain-containing protein [Nocardioides sp.]
MLSSSELRATRPVNPSRTPIGEIASWLGVEAPSATVEVTGLSLSSQRILPGDLYAALPGARVHGATCAADALTSGAVGVLTDPAGVDVLHDSGLAAHVPVLVVAKPREVLGRLGAWIQGRPAESMAMIAVTGTQGKTTTTRLAEIALEGAGIPAAVIGTVGTRVKGEEIRTS